MAGVLIQFRHPPFGARPLFAATALLIAFVCAPLTAAAQWMGKQTGCYAREMEANPNRPTVANPADVTQYGVLELEYGWDRVWPERATRQTSTGGLLKFGLLCDIELRWNTTPFVSQSDSSGVHQSLGDNWLGPQIRIYRQTSHVPAMAFSYAVKVPSASTEAGLGSGKVDHAFTFLASKDIAGTHFDFNVTQQWVGRPYGSGFDNGRQANLAFSHPIYRGLQFQGEFYGDTGLNYFTPGFVSSLWALSYTIAPRLVVDGGYEVGITAGGPHRHAFFGATYSIANLYPGWKRRQRHP